MKIGSGNKIPSIRSSGMIVTADDDMFKIVQFICTNPMNVSTCTYICIHPRHPESPTSFKKENPSFQVPSFLGSSLYFSETYHITDHTEIPHTHPPFGKLGLHSLQRVFFWLSLALRARKGYHAGVHGVHLRGPVFSGKKIKPQPPTWYEHLRNFYAFSSKIMDDTWYTVKHWDWDQDVEYKISFTCIRSSSPPTRNIQ